MSTINKKPFIKLVLESMSAEEVATLSALIDGSGNQTALLRTMSNKPTGNRTNITSADKGVHLCNLEVGFTLFQGYLIYTDSYCVLIHFTDAQVLGMFDIDLNDLTSYATVSEALNVLELRSEVYDIANKGGSDTIIATVNEALTDGDITIKADAINPNGAEEGSVLTVDENGEAIWGESSGGGLPEAPAANKVIVSDNNLQGQWQDSVPLADNLTGTPINNDALYTRGPTGGLADISTGEEAYLHEIKGYTIIWNNLVDANHSYTCKSGHYYMLVSSSGCTLYGPNYTSTVSAGSSKQLFDLTLMFGGNDKIPFSLTNYTEYPINGDIPAQGYTAPYGFYRLFANTYLNGVEYNEGTPKNVNVTKLVETGRNLWNKNDNDMVNNGLLLLPGYRYEIYTNNDGYIYTSKNNGSSWFGNSLSKVQRGDGKYIYYYFPTQPTLIKSQPNSANRVIQYVGFVHSGNYCLTTGTLTNSSGATDVEIPAFEKHEFDITGIDGLNGVTLSDGTIVADTKDYTRVGHIADLSSLTWTAGSGTYSATIADIKPSTTGLLATKYIGTEMSVDSTGVITITTSSSPTGELFYELNEAIPTGEDAFEPIPLKANGEWIVNDMGSEYFIQPANTNCPVNQLSLYFENLKDKLVNLSIPEIKDTTWNENYEPLNAISINGVSYRLLPQGTLGWNDKTANILIGNGSTITSGNSGRRYTNNVCIGESTQVIGGSSVVVGARALASVPYGSERYGMVSIGYYATTNVQYATAIGYRSICGIADAVSFDGNQLVSNTSSGGGQRTLMLYDPTKLFFKNDYTTKSSYAAYTAGHYLSEYIQNNPMHCAHTNGTTVFESATANSSWYSEYTNTTNYKTFTKNVVNGVETTIDKKINGVHIVVELRSYSRNCVSLDLLPYDSTNGPCYSYGRIVIELESGGTKLDCEISAYIDSDGAVQIDCPDLDWVGDLHGISPDMSVKYTIK